MNDAYETYRKMLNDITLDGYLQAFFFIWEFDMKECGKEELGLFDINKEGWLKTAGEVTAIETYANDLRNSLEEHGDISEEESEAISEYMLDEQFGMDIAFTRYRAGVSISDRADNYSPPLPGKWIKAIETAIHKLPETYWDELFDWEQLSE